MGVLLLKGIRVIAGKTEVGGMNWTGFRQG